MEEEGGGKYCCVSIDVGERVKTISLIRILTTYRDAALDITVVAGRGGHCFLIAW